MEEKNQVFVIGYDICNDFTQVSYLNGDMTEPESVSAVLNEQKFLFPTKKIERDGKNFIDSAFIEKILKRVPGYKSPDELTALMVSVEEFSKEEVEAMIDSFVEIGISKEKISIQSHSESCIYYALSQKNSFQSNDIVFFELTSRTFNYRLLQVRKDGKRPIIQIIEKDFSDVFPMKQLVKEESEEDKDKLFLEIIQKEFERKNIGAVYLIGEGFYQEEWAKESLKFLCKNRRVFKGNNLYTKGATYAALDECRKKVFQDYTLICEGRISWSISLTVEHKEEPKQVILAKAGSKWYEIESEVECILDDVKTLELSVTSALTRETRIEEISLNEFPYRNNKMTRVSIHLIFADGERALIKLKDLGFGDIILGSGKIIKKELFL